eukprot:g40096.t1
MPSSSGLPYPGKKTLAIHPIHAQNDLVKLFKKAIRKTEAKMQWKQEQMVSKEHEVGKQRLAHEIQLMLQKCEIEKEKAVAEAIEKEKQLASHTLDQVVTTKEYIRAYSPIQGLRGLTVAEIAGVGSCNAWGRVILHTSGLELAHV